jgi:hypothetical protein
MKLLLENWRKYLKEAEWSASPDHDYPAANTPKFAKNLKSKTVIVFNPEDRYEQQGEAHGKDSHAIKHYVEFNPNEVQEKANGALEYIKSLDQDVYSISAGSSPVVADKEQIKAGDLLNTFDYINDKNLNSIQLTAEEGEVYNRFVQPLATAYDGVVDEMISGGLDVSDESVQTAEGLSNLLVDQPVIKFRAIFSNTGEESTYYVDTKNSAMVVVNDSGQVSTLFNRAKKLPGHTLNLKKALKDFASGKRTVPADSYSLLRGFIDQLVGAQ